MKVVCNRDALDETLSLLSSVVASRTTRPILQCLRLQTENDGLTLLGTDLEQGLRCHIKEVEIEEEGQAVASASKLSAIVRQIDEKTITLSLEEDQLLVTAPGASFKLYTFDPEEYPPVAPGDGGKKFTATGGLLKTMVQETAYAAARETSRYAINGLHLEVKDKKLLLVGTDGRRLVRGTGTLPSKASDEITCIIPSKSVSMIEHLGDDGDAPVEVTITESQAAFATAKVLYVTNLVEGRFPNYEAVIPKDSEGKATVDRVKFLSAVRRAALMTSKESHSIKLSISQDKMTLEAKVPEEGEATVEIPVKSDGELVEIAFNPEYLSDPLRVLPHEEVTLEYRSATTPMVMKAGPDFLYVLMPVTV